MRFAQVDPDTGRVVSVIHIATTVTGDHVVPLEEGTADPTGKVWDGSAFVDPPAPPPAPRIIPQPEFVDRFAMDELVALKTLATQTNADGIQAAVFWDQVMTRKTINLDSAMAQAGMSALIAWSILTPERASVVFG